MQDSDFDYHCIHVWHGKGGKHLTVTLTPEPKTVLNVQIGSVQSIVLIARSVPLLAISDTEKQWRDHLNHVVSRIALTTLRANLTFAAEGRLVLALQQPKY